MIFQSQKNSSDVHNKYNSEINSNNYNINNNNNMKYMNQISKLSSTKDLSAEIKLI
jgi:hypothetical protein